MLLQSRLLFKKANPYNTTLRAFMDFSRVTVPLHQLRSTDPVPEPDKVFRLEFELFGKQAPLCTENFARLCTGEMAALESEASDSVHEPTFRDQFLPRLHYQNTALHRVVRDYIVQGGDVTENFVAEEPDTHAQPSRFQRLHYPDGRVRTEIRDVQPTVSAFGEEFDAGAELGKVKFDKSGLIGTAVTAPHKNHAQFFVLLAPQAEHLDGTCVCFGRVTKGLDELKKWQKSVRLNFEGSPLTRVHVSKCGML